MGEYFGGAFAVALLIYFIICSTVVPAYLLKQSNEQSQCAREHNVYRCEMIKTWVPVTPATQAGEG